MLTRTDPEKAHHAAFRAIRAAQPVTRLVGGRRTQVEAGPTTRVMGLDFPGLLGPRGGLRQERASASTRWPTLGFGFVEIGTVTGEPQPGNPQAAAGPAAGRPGVVNRMGFNNDGAEVGRPPAGRAAARPHRPPRRRTARASTSARPRWSPRTTRSRDYEKSTTLLAPYADYLVVNVSSPNTPGLRDLQAVSRLEPLLRAVRRRADDVSDRHVPLLVKIAPDLDDEDVLAVADLAVELGLDGDRRHQHHDLPRRAGLARRRRSRPPAPAGSPGRRCARAPPRCSGCCAAGSGRT